MSGLMNHISNKKQMGWPYIKNCWVNGIILTFGGICLGTMLAYSSPTLPQIKDEFHFSDFQATMFNTCGFLCGVVGNIIMSFLASRIGRRYAAFISAAYAFILWFILAESKKLWVVFLLRCLTGVTTGLFSSVIPVFICEVAPPHLTGLFGYLNQLGTAIGYWIPNLIGDLVHPWRQVTRLCSIPSGVLLLFVLFVPDRVGAVKGASYSAVAKYSGSCIRSLIILLLQQYSGINALLSNLVTIIKDAKLNVNTTLIQDLSTVVQIVTTLVSAFIVDKVGRKFCWLLSTVLQFIAFLILSLQQIKKLHGNIFMIGMFLEQFSFGLGMGPIPFLLVAELFPEEVRSTSMALMTIAAWVCASLVCFTWPYMNDSMGLGYSFLFFDGVSVLSILYGIFGINGPLIQKNENTQDEKQTVCDDQENSEEIEDAESPSGKKEEEKSQSEKTESNSFSDKNASESSGSQNKKSESNSKKSSSGSGSPRNSGSGSSGSGSSD